MGYGFDLDRPNMRWLTSSAWTPAVSLVLRSFRAPITDVLRLHAFRLRPERYFMPSLVGLLPWPLYGVGREQLVN